METVNENPLRSVAEAAERLGLSPNATRQITRGRDGRHDFRIPGSKKATIRIEQKLIDELLRQSDASYRKR